MVRAYLVHQRRPILFFSLLVVVFALVFSLYDLPVEAVGYATVLSCSIGGVLGAIDFFFFWAKHRKLLRMEHQIRYEIDSLPVTKDIIERDYQKLIGLIHEEKTRCLAEAEQENCDRTDYYTLWAHQIKTPIAAMRLLLQSGEVCENADIALELFKIEGYVEMVLQYLRLDASTTDYVLSQYELDGIIKQAVRKYAKLFIHKKIRLEYQDISTAVVTDEKWLLFALEQILSNALKYTRAGTISIYMDEREECTLVIEDTGIGIQAEDILRVFEKGYTGYNGRADKKSTGIGLYLCKRILTHLGHTITIESEAGKGTKVRIGLGSMKMDKE